MKEATLIRGKDEYVHVFVDAWDDGGVWLSIQTPYGGAHCALKREQAQQMIEALQEILKEQA